ncbi:hypothetical protein J6590_094701 [Homalodisca vitripennis]|nr:hypothetical protein J6590_036509 [Homalodisca vitripennis]KAG8284803.1 hypothetical protein J6590_094701 [Homalodisca vitripennis]
MIIIPVLHKSVNIQLSTPAARQEFSRSFFKNPKRCPAPQHNTGVLADFSEVSVLLSCLISTKNVCKMTDISKQVSLRLADISNPQTNNPKSLSPAELSNQYQECLQKCTDISKSRFLSD